eukprot:755304-Hanusia_phi.AAC.1
MLGNCAMKRMGVLGVVENSTACSEADSREHNVEGGGGGGGGGGGDSGGGEEEAALMMMRRRMRKRRGRRRSRRMRRRRRRRRRRVSHLCSNGPCPCQLLGINLLHRGSYVLAPLLPTVPSLILVLGEDLCLVRDDFESRDIVDDLLFSVRDFHRMIESLVALHRLHGCPAFRTTIQMGSGGPLLGGGELFLILAGACPG